MSKIIETNEKIAEKVVEGYKKIEDGVVEGYQKIEKGTVDGFNRMNDKIIEKVFSIPGLGNYFVTSITGLDYTMTLGLVVFQATIVVFANFIVDLLYGIIDPRVRIV